MIKVRCFTNLDDYDCSKVTHMVSTPLRGDRVEVMYRGSYATLKVVGVTHGMYNDGIYPKDQPYLQVELHK